MSYLDSLDPEALLDYKQRAKDIYNSLQNGNNLQQAEGLTNAALGLGLTLHHAGIIGKDGIFSGFSDFVGDAKNIREAGQNAMKGIKQMAQDKFEELTSGEGEQDGIMGTIGQTAKGLLSGATGEGEGLVGTLGQTAKGLLSGATGEGQGLAGTLGQAAKGLLSSATGEGQGLARTVGQTARGLAESVGEGGAKTVLNARQSYAGAKQLASGLLKQGEGEADGLLSGAKQGITSAKQMAAEAIPDVGELSPQQGTGLISRVLSRLRRPTITRQPVSSNIEMQDINAFEPSQEVQNLTNRIFSAGSVKASDLAELRTIPKEQIERILDGDVTELGQGMSDRLFDRLLQTRQKLINTGRTLGAPEATPADDNIYSMSAGDAINQARLSGELKESNSEPLSGEEIKPTTQLTLKEPNEPSASSSSETLEQSGITENITPKENIAPSGQESVDQVADEAAKSLASAAGKEAGEDTLAELTADSTALDETPIGGLVTVGLGIASLFEEIFGLHHHEDIQPIVQSGQQVGV